MLTPISIEPLDWENQFFHIYSGIVKTGTGPAISSVDLAPFDLVQARVDSQQAILLDQLSGLGFKLVEGEAELWLNTEQAIRQNGITIARQHHIPELRQMAGDSFAMSRFRSPWYRPEESSRFYAQWIENAVLSRFDHQCLLATCQQGNIQGFVSLREREDGKGQMGLLATSPKMRAQGVGERLVQAAVDWCRARRLTQLKIVTQLSNVAAMRLYLRCGARLENTAYWLYRTSNDSI